MADASTKEKTQWQKKRGNYRVADEYKEEQRVNKVADAVQRQMQGISRQGVTI